MVDLYGDKHTNDMNLETNQLQRSVCVQVENSDKLYTVLMDTGANCSVISSKLVQELGLAVTPPSGNPYIDLADIGAKIKRPGTVTIMIKIQFINGSRPPMVIKHTFEIMNISYNFLFGLDILQHTSPTDDAVVNNRFMPSKLNKLLFIDLDMNGKPYHTNTINKSSSSSSYSVPVPEATQMKMFLAYIQKEHEVAEAEMIELDRNMFSLKATNSSSSSTTSSPPSTSHTDSHSRVCSLCAAADHDVLSCQRAIPAFDSYHSAYVSSSSTSPHSTTSSTTTTSTVGNSFCSNCNSTSHDLEECPDVVAHINELLTDNSSIAPRSFSSHALNVSVINKNNNNNSSSSSSSSTTDQE